MVSLNEFQTDLLAIIIKAYAIHELKMLKKCCNCPCIDTRIKILEKEIEIIRSKYKVNP